jgi:hypothetical protein
MDGAHWQPYYHLTPTIHTILYTGRAPAFILYAIYTILGGLFLFVWDRRHSWFSLFISPFFLITVTLPHGQPLSLSTLR